MTSLVTGGAGFIGSNLVRHLLEEGSEVVVIDDLSTGLREHLPRSSKLTFIEANLSEVPDLDRLIRRCEFVFHLAAQVGNMRSIQDPVRDAQTNVMATVRLLDACRNGSVRMIVCSASAAAFGEAQTIPITEDHPQRPESFYALSKMAAEWYAVLASSLLKLPAVCLRYFNVYGLPFAKSEYAGVIASFLDCLQRDRPLVIYGDGSQDRDFVYVKDVVTANLLAARKGTPGGVYNIGTGTATTVLELAHLMSELAGRTPWIDFQPFRTGEVRHSMAGIDRARADLGYAPSYDLRAGLLEIWGELWTGTARGDV